MTKEEFLIDVQTWNDHLPLLWLALEQTKDSKLPVIEYGSGGGSTPYLRKYCLDNNREFISYDYNKEWAEKTGSTYVENWEQEIIYRECSVVLIDESPGEHRHESVLIMKDRADILVLHDVEEAGYMYDKCWEFFKYRVNCHKGQGGAEAAALSNKIDITQWGEQVLAGFKITI
jgi:hypothetical protein